MFWGCHSSSELKVAVAANLTAPMQEIAQAYEAETGIPVSLSSASSGVLTAQITHGAPFDLFFSADTAYTETLYKQGFGQQEPKNILSGHWVFWTKKDYQLKDIHQLIENPEIKTIAIANPELAPYGQQARNWLQFESLWDSIQRKLVYGENIGQVNQYIYSGSVDGAFTAVSAQHAENLSKLGRWIDPGIDSQSGIPHNIILLKDASPQAQSFLEFLQGEKAKEVFQRYGYRVGQEF